MVEWSPEQRAAMAAFTIVGVREDFQALADAGDSRAVEWIAQINAAPVGARVEVALALWNAWHREQYQAAGSPYGATDEGFAQWDRERAEARVAKVRAELQAKRRASAES